MSDSNAGAATERRSTKPAKRVAAKAPVLPSARAAVGALLCVLAALLTFVAYRQAQQPPTTKYLVAAREMEPGAELTIADFTEEAITLPPEVAAKAFSNFAQIENAFLLGPIQQGELLQASNLVRRAGGTASHEWSFTIEAINAAGGRIRVGERIQILGTTTREGSSVTEIVNPGALVIGLDRTDPNPFRGTLSILLALNNDEEVFRLETAKNTQKLTVVRGPGANEKANSKSPGQSGKDTGAKTNTEANTGADESDNATDNQTPTAVTPTIPSASSNSNAAQNDPVASNSPEPQSQENVAPAQVGNAS